MIDDKAEGKISEVTRRAIIDRFALGEITWSGRLRDDELLARLYDLAEMKSTDYRYRDAAGDIYQHTVRNSDWSPDWVFYDTRFNLFRASDEEFLRFLTETLHPLVRTSTEDAVQLAEFYNEALAPDGYRFVETSQISGRPVYTAQSAHRAIVFTEPTGWEKVDRQIAEMRTRLDAAETEEQFQAVGLLSREAMISAAQAVFVPERHPILDGLLASDTDAKRMLEAIFATGLGGSANEEARTHARAAVKLALALQHKRTADFRTAALCAEGTTSVINMLAIIAGRRGHPDRQP
jgi:hypothetical protein